MYMCLSACRYLTPHRLEGWILGDGATPSCELSSESNLATEPSPQPPKLPFVLGSFCLHFFKTLYLSVKTWVGWMLGHGNCGVCQSPPTPPPPSTLTPLSAEFCSVRAAVAYLFSHHSKLFFKSKIYENKCIFIVACYDRESSVVYVAGYCPDKHCL